ncbi:MAG TPA: DMT family transporter [Rubrivivax sp.]|nr:DMT family transporter [Rubrivivax sp.]
MSSPRPFVLAAAGIAALCALDAAVKELTRSYAVAYAVLGRYVFGTLFALAVWWWQGRPRLTREMLPAHLLRGTLITVTAFLFFFSLTRLDMAEAITLSFVAPLLIPPLAHLFLGEKMRGPVVLAAFVGFAGVLLTVQGAPSFDGERALALGAVLGAALTYAMAAIVMRARAAKDGSTLLTLTSAVIPMLLLSPAAVGAPLPTWSALGLAVLAGLLGNLGIQLLARAYASAEAQALGVLEFTALPWAALFGWLFFGEAVRPQVWLGALVIFAACWWVGRADQKTPAILPTPQ